MNGWSVCQREIKQLWHAFFQRHRPCGTIISKFSLKNFEIIWHHQKNYCIFALQKNKQNAAHTITY
jgi:hypothetical protein